MKAYGYINLKEAERISGKTVEALKKQCQEGRIRGAVKDSGSWYVPRDEIIVKPSEPNDDALTLLVISAEAAGTGINVTLYVKGLVIEGRLISTAKFVDFMRPNTRIKVPNDEAAEARIERVLNERYDLMLKRSKEGKIEFIHLEHASIIMGSADYEPKGTLLRIRADHIDGFQLGTTKTLPTTVT